jgi:small GTP-binding protein
MASGKWVRTASLNHKVEAVTKKDIEAHTERILALNHPGVVKVLVVGNAASGKTSLIEQFAQDRVPAQQVPSTHTVDFLCKTVSFRGEDIQLRVYDSPGASSFAPEGDMAWSQYYAGMHVVLICFDISRRESFESVPHWLTQVATCGGQRDSASTVVPLLVGTKCDVPKCNREVRSCHRYILFRNW